MGLNPKGRNWGSLVNWDDLGKAYAGFIISWTVILGAGMVWLILNRNLPFIRIRNVLLAVSATSFLHIYLVKIFLAYTTNGHFTCSAEFWIMSIYLPFGIALFQANLAQLKNISDEQQNLLSPRSSISSNAPLLSKTLVARRSWTSLSTLQRTYLYIGLGMAIQLIITGVLYATTPALRDDWTSYGHISHAKGQARCRKSPQWIPSAFWQLFWSWIYGPYTLYQIRRIRDVHYWRLSIVLSVIAGLPGAPLWIASVFSDAFKPVNPWWVPPMWLAPGIIVMQFTTIFFPIYEAFRDRKSMRTTLAILGAWEEARDKGTAGSSFETFESNGASRASFDSSLTANPDSRRHRETCSILSLDKALEVNPAPLLEFAASKEFTAENVLFLMQVRRWRASYQAASEAGSGQPGAPALVNLFNKAVEIYVARVHHQTTDFPINLDHKTRKNLDEIFEPAIPEGRFVLSEKVDPFSFDSPPEKGQLRRASSDDTLHEETTGMSITYNSAAEKSTTDALFEPHPCVAPLGQTHATIRPGFNEHVFDAAEASIKYLVLTNTWQKFVKFRMHETNFGHPV